MMLCGYCDRQIQEPIEGLYLCQPCWNELGLYDPDRFAALFFASLIADIMQIADYYGTGIMILQGKTVVTEVEDTKHE